jgi:hypothetical protein
MYVDIGVALVTTREGVGGTGVLTGVIVGGVVAGVAPDDPGKVQPHTNALPSNKMMMRIVLFFIGTDLCLREHKILWLSALREVFIGLSSFRAPDGTSLCRAGRCHRLKIYDTE